MHPSLYVMFSLFSHLWCFDPLFRSFTSLHWSYYGVFEKIGFPSFDLYCWITFFLLPAHSSSLPHSFSPFLCLHSILPYFFTLFYMGKVYVMFQHTLLSLFPYFALFNWSHRIFVFRTTTKKKSKTKQNTHSHKKKKEKEKEEKCMQWWKRVPFHSNCSPSWIVLPLFSNRTCISKLGNSHQSVWQNFPVFSQKVCIFQMPVTYH